MIESAYDKVGKSLVKKGEQIEKEQAAVDRAFKRRLASEKYRGKPLTQNPFKGLKLD